MEEDLFQKVNLSRITFGEDELDFMKMDEVVPFDGMSCKAFKLDRLRMSKQSRKLEDDTPTIPP